MSAHQATLPPQIRDLGHAAIGDGARALISQPDVVGRLGNLSVIWPSVRPHVRVGYQISNAPFPIVRLAADGQRERELTALCDEVDHLISVDAGIPLMPASLPPPSSPLAATCLTDASGEDGCGGVLLRWGDDPLTLVLFSMAWPEDIRRALAASAQRKVTRDPDADRLSMPAAEAFASALATVLVARRRVVPVVYNVTDCKPAAQSINSTSSTSPPMQHIIRWGLAQAEIWVAVHVHRQFNRVPDALSHPARLAEMRAAAQEAGFNVLVAEATSDDWDVLRHAISLPPEGWEW